MGLVWYPAYSAQESYDVMARAGNPGY